MGFLATSLTTPSSFLDNSMTFYLDEQGGLDSMVDFFEVVWRPMASQQVSGGFTNPLFSLRLQTLCNCKLCI